MLMQSTVKAQQKFSVFPRLSLETKEFPIVQIKKANAARRIRALRNHRVPLGFGKSIVSGVTPVYTQEKSGELWKNVAD